MTFSDAVFLGALRVKIYFSVVCSGILSGRGCGLGVYSVIVAMPGYIALVRTLF